MPPPAAAAGTAVTLRDAMARLRDRLVAEQEQARAARPVDPPRAVPRSVAVPFPPDLVEDLVAFAERGGAAEGDELPEGLAARACEALAAGPKAAPGPKASRGASAARAQAALGRAGVLTAALRANNLAVADRAMTGMEEATGVAVPPELDAVARRAALRVLIDVQMENARRERGEYPRLPDDPAMDVAIAEPAPLRSVAETAAVPVAPEPASEGPAPGEETVSALMTEWIEKSRSSRRKTVSNKVLRDRKVACDLFVELCGDLPPSLVTRAVCERFVEDLLGVPVMHGRGEYAEMTAREAIEATDRRDEELKEAGGAKTGRASDGASVARLSRATVNKHLSALEGGVAPYIGRPEGAPSPFAQVRFSKKDVKSAPAFVRRAPSDELLQAIFHGPLFTGNDGGAGRAKPGPHLDRDTRYWVPLVALLSGACLEELLQLRPQDIHRKGGIDVIDIGAEGAQVKTFARPRLVPVHPQLRRLGFLEHAADMRARGEALLFPGFAPAGPDDRMGHAFTRFWTEYRRGIGAYLRGADLHACRHAVNTKLLNKLVPEAVIKHVLGHAQQGMTGRDYNSGVGLEAAAEAIGRLSYECIDFSMLEAKARRRV